MVKFETVRIVMAITAADDLEIVQFDIKTTFLNDDLAELLYMEQPEGFIDKDYPDYVCLLRKALYGLKQTSRNWNHKFPQFLLQFGFTASDADPVRIILPKADRLLYCLSTSMMALFVSHAAPTLTTYLIL